MCGFTRSCFLPEDAINRLFPNASSGQLQPNCIKHKFWEVEMRRSVQNNCIVELLRVLVPLVMTSRTGDSESYTQLKLVI